MVVESHPRRNAILTLELGDNVVAFPSLSLKLLYNFVRGWHCALTELVSSFGAVTFAVRSQLAGQYGVDLTSAVLVGKLDQGFSSVGTQPDFLDDS